MNTSTSTKPEVFQSTLVSTLMLVAHSNGLKLTSREGEQLVERTYLKQTIKGKPRGESSLKQVILT